MYHGLISLNVLPGMYSLVYDCGINFCLSLKYNNTVVRIEGQNVLCRTLGLIEGDTVLNVLRELICFFSFIFSCLLSINDNMLNK